MSRSITYALFVGALLTASGCGGGGAGSGGAVTRQPLVAGSTSDVNAQMGTLSVAAQMWQDVVLAPGQVVKVVTDGATDFRGQADEQIDRASFFIAAASSPVKTEGPVQVSAGIVTVSARKCKLEASVGNGSLGNGQDVEIHGAVSSFDANAGNLVMSAQAWMGANLTQGQSVTVATTGSTRFRNDEGDNISKAAFFAALSNGHLIEAEGHWSGAGMVATKLKLDDD